MEKGVRNFLYWVDKQSKDMLKQSRDMCSESSRSSKSDLMKSNRFPKCARCRNHGMVNDLKGHKYVCRWRNCTCQNCAVVKDKQRITASRVAKLRKMRKVYSDKLDSNADLINSGNNYNGSYNEDLDERSTGSPASISTISTNSESHTSFDTIIDIDHHYREISPQFRPLIEKYPVKCPCNECNVCIQRDHENDYYSNLRYLADLFPMCSIKTLGEALLRAKGDVKGALDLMR